MFTYVFTKVFLKPICLKGYRVISSNHEPILVMPGPQTTCFIVIVGNLVVGKNYTLNGGFFEAIGLASLSP